jgi:hypothetical protein
VERIGGQLGRVALGRNQAAEGLGHVVGRDPGGVQGRTALDQLDDGAAGGACGAAPVGVEAGLRNPVSLDAHRDANQVAAGGPARGAGVRPARESAQPARGG